MPTTFPTFEQWIEGKFADVEMTPERREQARVTFYEPARRKAEQYPAVIPPCPSWCVLEPGHEYDSTTWEDDPAKFYRYHSSVPNGAACRVRVEAAESSQAGVVTVETPKVVVYDDTQEWGAAGARRFAQSLLDAAALVERIGAQQ